jgi:hypothetical protein
MLPFIGLTLVPLWETGNRGRRAGLLALAAPSFALSLACATFYMTTPLVADGIGPVQDEVFQFILPHFLSGDVHHPLAPNGKGGLPSLAWLLLPVAVELVASGALPISRRAGQGARQAACPHSPILP